MTNLIQNGLQSVNSNKKTKININLKNDLDKISILVSDNGSGVDPNLKNKIFEPMFTTKTKGMGLGLGIVKKIIEIHKGRISYKSENKIGTTFTIELPKNKSK